MRNYIIIDININILEIVRESCYFVPLTSQTITKLYTDLPLLKNLVICFNIVADWCICAVNSIAGRVLQTVLRASRDTKTCCVCHGIANLAINKTNSQCSIRISQELKICAALL